MTQQHWKPLLADTATGGGAGGGATVEVTRPWDGAALATVEKAGADAAQAALETAHAVYRNRDAWLTPAQRIEILEKTCRMMGERADELALQAAAEGGKPLPDSQVEVARAIVSLQSCVDCLRGERGHGERIPMGVNAASLNRIAFTIKEPIGVVLAFSAFNHPVNLIAHQVGPAIAAGCPVVVKPAEATPLSCFTLVQMLHEAGLPPAHCQALLVDGHDVSKRLVADERVGFFSFIGSDRVGWMLRNQLAPGARCALEHGGMAPVVIAADADLDDALPLIAKGGFYHAGQVCVSVQRVFAHSSVARDVAARLAKLGEAMVIGDPTLADTEVGPLIRPGEVERVGQWVAESGAEVVCGGERVSDTAFQCTVLYDPPADAKVTCREVFGPVVCVYPFDDLAEAVERANELPYSFQAAVITRDLDAAAFCVRRLDAATVLVNDHTAFRVDWMPFAGHKRSGYGTGGVPYTFDDMQADKLVVMRSKNW